MSKRRDGRESVGDVLFPIREALGSHANLAFRLGVSRKTAERYLYDVAMPPPARRHAMLAGVAGAVNDALVRRLGAALEVPEHQWPVPRPVAVVPSIEDPLELALFASAERHDVSPARARLIALDVLTCVVQLDASSLRAHAALLAVVTKRGSAKATT